VKSRTSSPGPIHNRTLLGSTSDRPRGNLAIAAMLDRTLELGLWNNCLYILPLTAHSTCMIWRGSGKLLYMQEINWCVPSQLHEGWPTKRRSGRLFPKPHHLCWLFALAFYDALWYLPDAISFWAVRIEKCHTLRMSATYLSPLDQNAHMNEISSMCSRELDIK